MISPCRSCSLEFIDKNNDTCMRCAKRIKYVASLEGLTCSVPVEMTDMAMSPEKVKQHDQFMIENPDMKVPQIAKQLGRSQAAIYSRRFKLGLTKPKRDAERTMLADRTKAVHSEPENLPPRRAELTRSADLAIINIKGYEELYERLKRSAQANFRTPELQALWFIHKGLAAESGAGDQRRAPDGTS